MQLLIVLICEKVVLGINRRLLRVEKPLQADRECVFRNRQIYLAGSNC